MTSQRIPRATEYDFLAEKLGASVTEVHELCMAERKRVEPANSSAEKAPAAV